MLRDNHKSRINKVLDFIESNISDKFTLEQLASVSNYSKFHFIRIFQEVTQETPFKLILRLRLEKAASLLSNSNESISEIAYRCGFRSLAVFSKNFKTYFGLSASQFRKNSNLNKVNSTNGNTDSLPSIYICNKTRSIKWKRVMKNNISIDIKTLSNIPVVYIRHVGPYQEDTKLFERLFSRLFAWAEPRGLLDTNDFQTVIVYHDDVKVTDKKKLRTSICLTAPEGIKVDGEINKMVLEKGKYVVARFILKENEFQEAWDWLMGIWFPSSGYQPLEKSCFELYTNEPEDGIFTVDICVPVKKR